MCWNVINAYGSSSILKLCFTVTSCSPLKLFPQNINRQLYRQLTRHIYSTAPHTMMIAPSNHKSITITSRFRGFVTLGLVNIHAMHQTCGYISKKIMDLIRKKQVVKWQTSPVSVFTLRDTVVSRRLLERLGLVSVLKVERLVSSRSWVSYSSVTSFEAVSTHHCTERVLAAAAT